ncbi:hypothetical protein HYC85_005040 [Camellia sinensis]|uniref:Uncharacterized protein n=1 Tax=Camellia sinensis TaxID=4442 RepID=A0A7J7HZ99_CAMSI|nr:hypothetical protein HYC85_005040 [Camellia sinensis]
MKKQNNISTINQNNIVFTATNESKPVSELKCETRTNLRNTGNLSDLKPFDNC